MTDSEHFSDPEASAASGGLWPSPDYPRQIERLRAAVGETIYLVEVVESAIQLSVHISGTPYELLAVIDFPRPDPTRGLAPHLLLLDDGRGLNLGRIVRVSRRPFAPQAADLLYLDPAAAQNLLFAERRLSPSFLAHQTRIALAECLGYASAEFAQLPLQCEPDAEADIRNIKHDAAE